MKYTTIVSYYIPGNGTIHGEEMSHRTELSGFRRFKRKYGRKVNILSVTTICKATGAKIEYC